METDNLIRRLAAEPLGAPSARLVLARALGAGAIVSLIAMALWLHVRPDIASAVTTFAFWMKLTYAATLGALAFPIVTRLARPVGRAERADLVLLAPLAVLALIAAVELYGATAAERIHLMMGASSNVCSWRIVILSLPVFVPIAAALRTLAPTQLTLAGAAAGLLAGAIGTLVYALHCDESAAPFVLIWYSLGMALVGVVGGLLGDVVLRWR